MALNFLSETGGSAAQASASSGSPLGAPSGVCSQGPSARPARECGRSPPVMSCSVIICAHSMDRWPDICEAVRSVQVQETPAHEIILVIDHNRSLLDRCREAFPGVKVIENREVKGLSSARNSGVWAATGDIVAFLDDDAIADPRWIKVMAPSFEDPSNCGVGAAAEARWLAAKPKWFPDEFLWVVGCTYRGLEPGVVRNGLGCAMGLRRSIFESIGGFDSRLGRNGSRLPISCHQGPGEARENLVGPRESEVRRPFNPDQLGGG